MKKYTSRLSIIVTLMALGACGAGCYYRGPVTATDLRHLEHVAPGDRLELVSGDSVRVTGSATVVVKDSVERVTAPLGAVRYDAAADVLLLPTEAGLRSLEGASRRSLEVEAFSAPRTVGYTVLAVGSVATTVLVWMTYSAMRSWAAAF